MRIGYARESRHGQPLQVQIDKLKDCDTVFKEKAGNGDQQKTLDACLDALHHGDILVVTRLDRLADNTLSLARIAERLRRQGIDLVVRDQDIDTSKDSNDAALKVMAAIADIKQSDTEQHTATVTPIQRGKALDTHTGVQLSKEQIAEMQYRIACGEEVSELCDEYNISIPTFYHLTD
ncbi:recombinase family protein [Methylophaga sp.]|jgi:DNA invertase Pin-like site-specific DNA recombinase|uniref:recombinase family protein n=1 Tax=Methylophaga sp. TaxID=2024840 RepID=UPI00140009E9|nr:recombinase family protein [Methylophaga sp.]MTI63253.1 recombinase family protein [Methylophaga sp.]